MPSLKWANAKSRFVVASGAAKVAGIVGMLLVVGLGGCVASTDESGARDIEDVVFAEHWVTGEVRVQGTVANISVVESDLGTVTSLRFLAHQGKTVTYGKIAGILHEDCLGLVLPGAIQLDVGDQFEATLHFEEYSSNGRKAIFARELYCGLLSGTAAIARILDSVSVASWAQLHKVPGTREGAITYRVEGSPTHQVPLRDVAARLMIAKPEDGPVIDDIQEVSKVLIDRFAHVGRVSQGGTHQAWPEAAHLDRLDAGFAQPDGLRFLDRNGNGMMDDGDEFEVRVQPDPHQYSTAMLVVTDNGGNRFMFAFVDVGVILDAPSGIHPWPKLGFRSSFERVGETATIVLTCDSILSPQDMPVSSLNVSGSIRQSGGFEVRDADGDGHFEVGDALVFPGRAWHSLHDYTLIFDPVEGAGVVVGKGAVVVGYDIDLRTAGSWTYNTTDQPAGVAAIQSTRAWREYHFGRSLVASVSMGGVPLIENVTVVAGEAASWPGGKLHYDDADQSDGLSQGDRVMLVDALPGTYRVTLSALFGHKSESVVLTV